MSIKAKRPCAQPANRLLNGRGELGTLMRTAHLIEQAQRHLRAELPAEVAEHLFVGGFRDGRLALITDGAVWLTRLRYEQPRLLARLRRLPGFEAVTGFSLKVRPVRPVRPPPRQVRHLPAAAADALSRCAEDTEDPRLKAALQRLAAHGADEPHKHEPHKP